MATKKSRPEMTTIIMTGPQGQETIISGQKGKVTVTENVFVDGKKVGTKTTTR